MVVMVGCCFDGFSVVRWCGVVVVCGGVVVVCGGVVVW